MMKYVLLTMAAFMFSHTAGALELHPGSEFNPPWTVKLVIYEEITNVNKTFRKGDECQGKSADKLTVDSIRGSFLIAHYTNGYNGSPETECPNAAKLIVNTMQADEWLRAYAKKENDGFDNFLIYMMENGKKNGKDD
jgi:hypothetical protein